MILQLLLFLIVIISHPRIIKETGGFGGSRSSGDDPNYNIIENGQNTAKSPGDLRRLAVTQTPVKVKRLIGIKKIAI